MIENESVCSFFIDLRVSLRCFLHLYLLLLSDRREIHVKVLRYKYLQDNRRFLPAQCYEEPSFSWAQSYYYYKAEYQSEYLPCTEISILFIHQE